MQSIEQYTNQQYIEICLANTVRGMDRKTWTKRLGLAYEILNKDCSVAELLAEYDVKEPIMFRKIYSYIKSNKPVGEFTGSLDFTASGLQLLAIGTGCIKTAERTNLIFTNNREDAYEYAAKEMTETLGEEVTRDIIKNPLMTTFYGSTQKPLELLGQEAMPAYQDLLENSFTGAYLGFQLIQQCWNKETTSHEFYMPDGFHVVLPVTEVKTVEIEYEKWGVKIPYSYSVETKQDKGISLAANVVQAMDGYVCREIIRELHEDGVPVWPIHDCFMVKIKHMEHLRLVARKVLAKVCKQNLLVDILSQLTGEDQDFEKVDLSQSIEMAEYILS